MEFELKVGASYTWKSIWAAKKTLMDGLRWKIGRSDKVSICDDALIPDPFNCKVVYPVSNSSLVLVADLIDNDTIL